MKLKYFLKKTLNVKNSYIIGIIAIVLIGIIGYFSYAVFTARSESNAALNIVTGNLYVAIESADLDANKSITLEPNEQKTVTLKLINSNDRDAKVNLYYTSTSNNIDIGYLSKGDTPPDRDGYVLRTNGQSGDSKEIYVKISNKGTENATITFGANAGLANAELAFPNGMEVLELVYDCNSSDVICIKTSADLVNLANEVNAGDDKSGKDIYLSNDIDLGGKFNADGSAIDGTTYWTAIGTETAPFNGSFDGDGHVIKNLYINSSETSTTGLFGYVGENGLISNLGITSSYSVSNAGNASMVVNVLSGSINNVYNKGTVNGLDNTASLASVMLGNATIKNSYNMGNVTSQGTAGGLVGVVDSTSATMMNCYNAGVVTGTNVGGIVKESKGTLSNLYNLGNIVSSASSGGVIYNLLGGELSNSSNIGNVSVGGGVISTYDVNATITQNYYLDGTATYGIESINSDNNANRLSANDMPNIMNIINSENAFVEDINIVNNHYPILKWQE